MNSFDIAILVIVLVFAVIGAWRGFVREVLSLIVWGMGLAAAWFLGPIVADWPIAQAVDNPLWRQLGASAMIFLVIFVAGSLAALLLRKLFLNGARKTADHVLGAVFGALRGSAAVVLVVLVAGVTAVPRESWWHQSALAPYFEMAAVWSLDLLPTDWSHRVRF